MLFIPVRWWRALRFLRAYFNRRFQGERSAGLVIRRVHCISNGHCGRLAARLAGDFHNCPVVEPFDKSAKGKTTERD